MRLRKGSIVHFMTGRTISSTGREPISRRARRKGSRFVLLITTLSVAIYPGLVALTQNQTVIFILSSILGIFQAGIDLVFFDELMKTVPADYSATFVALERET